MIAKEGTAPKRGATEADGAARPEPLLSLDSALFRNVQVRIEARLGEVEMTIEELMALKPGSTVSFDRSLNEPVDLLLNGTLVARGEIVAVDDRYGVRIVEIADIR